MGLSYVLHTLGGAILEDSVRCVCFDFVNFFFFPLLVKLTGP